MIGIIPGRSARRTNLPAPASSFIGRERELADIGRLLRLHRLVLLTGPGGTGKTRLSLHAAAAELDRFADGVWLVELAPLASADLVADTIGQVLAGPMVPTTTELSPLERLCAVLRTRQLLLVLDNCEHVITACAQIVAQLLARCPAVAVLATSREPLGIAGEWVQRVPPLGLPDPSQSVTAVDLEHLLGYDAIRLFVERAQAAEPSFRLTEVNAAAVVDICRRLDGLPLALELAAVRVRGMGVAYLNTRLDDRFRLLTGGDRAALPRQQTLRTSLAWSYGLLPEPERAVLRRLGVFVGSYSLEAAEAVCAGADITRDGRAVIHPEAVLEHLLQLVNKSLVQLDQDSGHYRLLETIRLYARERLDEAGETHEVRRRHFVHYFRLAEDGVTLVGGPHQEAWFQRIEHEHDNFRAALGWAIEAGRADEASRMALGMWRFWHARTHQREGVRWLERILALAVTHRLPEAIRPRLLNALGVLAHRAGYSKRARAYHAEALRVWRERGDWAGMAQALFDIGWLHHDQVELEPARRCATRSLALAESVGDARLTAAALLLGAIADIESVQLHGALADPESGRPHGVIPALERSVVIWRELGDADNLATTLAVLAVAHQQSGEYERAKPLLAESVRLYVGWGNYGDLISALVGLMQQAAGASDRATEGVEMARDAARIIGAMRAWEETTSGMSSPWWTSELGQAIVNKITGRLGPEAFAEAVAEGKGLTTVGFLALADRITAPDHHVGPPRPLPPMQVTAVHAALTPRELEVLRLVAAGLTSAQIADRLTVTPRTVNAHLTAIYAKLGVTGRSRAIRYAIDHHLD